jgi:hypothetical protein
VVCERPAKMPFLSAIVMIMLCISGGWPPQNMILNYHDEGTVFILIYEYI